MGPTNAATARKDTGPRPVPTAANLAHQPMWRACSSADDPGTDEVNHRKGCRQRGANAEARDDELAGLRAHARKELGAVADEAPESCLRRRG
jgi:hypothetical protein